MAQKVRRRRRSTTGRRRVRRRKSTGAVRRRRRRSTGVRRRKSTGARRRRRSTGRRRRRRTTGQVQVNLNNSLGFGSGLLLGPVGLVGFAGKGAFAQSMGWGGVLGTGLYLLGGLTLANMKW